jgi:hypothetical protein
VLTIQETGKADQRVTDEQVLAFATAENRAVLTVNRKHFIRLPGRIPATQALWSAPSMRTSPDKPVASTPLLPACRSCRANSFG